MLRIILFGAPGSGKGTQARRIEREHQYKHVSTGDLIRTEIQKDTQLGRKMKILVDEGRFVPDDIMIELVKNRVNNEDIINGYIMDGFPRTCNQARSLTQIQVSREVAIYLNVQNEAVIVNRILSRLICSNCGAIFSTIARPPKKNGICDHCETVLVKRADDNETAIKERIRIYHRETLPVLEYYRNQGVLNQVDASLEVNTVFSKISELIN